MNHLGKPTIAGLVLALMFLVPPARAIEIPATPDNLSLAQAIDLAMAHNPQVLAARYQVAQAQDTARSQSLWWLRAINGNAGYYTGFTPGAPTTGTSFYGSGLAAGVGVGFNLGDLLAGPSQAAAAHAAYDTAVQNLRQVQAAVAAEVTTDFAAYQTQRQLLALRREAISADRSDQEVAERMFGSGTANIADVYKARLAISKGNADLIEAEGEMTRAWVTLLTTMGETQWLEAKH